MRKPFHKESTLKKERICPEEQILSFLGVDPGVIEKGGKNKFNLHVVVSPESVPIHLN